MRQYVYTLQRKTLKNGEPEIVKGPSDAYRFIMDNCYRSQGLYREYSYLVFLNGTNEILGTALLGIGGTKSVVMDEKVAVKLAILSMATSVILVHNHTSGSAIPSQNDITETARLKKALSCFDVMLVDHIVVADGGYYSFAEEKEYKVA